MTRFEKEISGLLGDYWKKHAEDEVVKCVAEAEAEAEVDENGVIRWKSNGECLPSDYCEKLEYAGYDFNREATKIASDKDAEEFFAEYRKNYKGPSDEEKAEMRAAFSLDTKVIDVITGKEINL